MICKRLEEGRFTKLNSVLGETVQMTASEFALLLEGSDLNRRFIESPKKFINLQN